MVDVREYNPNSPGSRGSSTRATLTPTFHIEISLREMRESFCGGTSLLHIEIKMHVKASAKRVQDLDKGDIIGGGDLRIGVDDVDDVYIYINIIHKTLGGGYCLHIKELLLPNISTPGVHSDSSSSYMQVMWSQTVSQRKSKPSRTNRGKQMQCQRTGYERTTQKTSYE